MIYLAAHLLQISDFCRTPVKPVLIRKCDADFRYAIGVDRQKNVNNLHNSFLLITYYCLVSGILVSHSWSKGCRITCWITKDLVQRITFLGLSHCWPSTAFSVSFLYLPIIRVSLPAFSCAVEGTMIMIAMGGGQLSPLTYSAYGRGNWGGIIPPGRHTDTRLTALFSMTTWVSRYQKVKAI